MSDRSDWTPEMEEAAEAVRGLPDVDAELRFRDDLKRSFVSGAIDAEPASAVPVRGRSSTRWSWAGLAAAALLAVALVTLNRGPVWEVVATQGSIRVAGGAAADLAAGERLSPGASVHLEPGAELVLRLSETAVIELTGGTEATLPGSPGRWWGKDLRASLENGEIRFKSGDRFAGTVLSVSTPEGLAEVRGTLVSIQRDDTGTCVCVLEGTVLVGVDAADLEPVTPGNRKVMPKANEAFITEVKPMHRDGVLEFSEKYSGSIRP